MSRPTASLVMVSLLATDLPARDRHHLMTSTILPRPIAWITSLGPAGQVNCAPFSFFNGVSSDPPLVSTVFGARRDGTPKDTYANIARTGEYVIHAVDESHAHQMVETAGAYPPEESEIDVVGLKTVPSDSVAVPRLADAALAMECRLYDVYGPRGSSARMVIGEIIRWHVRDGILAAAEDGPTRVDVHKLRPIGRLGNDEYCPVREVFKMTVPR